MTEPEVILRIALYYLKNHLTDEDIYVSIDGAHVKTGNTVYLDIWSFLHLGLEMLKYISKEEKNYSLRQRKGKQINLDRNMY